MKDFTKKPWKKMLLSDLITPKNDSLCKLGRWWIVTPDRHVLFYGESPQCNANEAVAKHLLNKLHSGCTIEFVAVAYVPHDCHDYV